MSRVLNKALNCNTSGLYQNSTNNGRAGYALTKVNTNRRLGTVYNVTKGVKTIRPGMARIGSGVQGVAYLASTSANGKQNVVIKVSPRDKAFSPTRQVAEVEYKIQKALYKIVPRHVPVPYKFIHCGNFVPVSDFTSRKPDMFDYNDQYVMYSEYAHGGSLKDWLHKMGRRVTDADMARMIRQVITTLKKIHSRYPQFRHNDLHLGNIFVDDTGDFPRLMIADFGLARLTPTGSNPVVNSGNHTNSGISGRTSVKYDVHYFLNCLDYEIRGMSYFPETKRFLARMLPARLRGANTTNVKMYRLKNGASNVSAPSFDKVLSDPFLAPARSNNSPMRNVGSPRVTVRNVHVERAMANRSGHNAAEIARNALAGIPGVHVTTNARRPTAAEFLRMSPRTRASMMAGRARGVAGESHSVVVRNTARVRGTAVVRNTVRRVGSGAGVRRLPLGTELRATRAGPTMTREEIREVLGSSSSNSNSNSAPRPVRRENRAAISPRRRVPMPAISPRRRAAISRATRAAHVAAGRNARARSGAARRAPPGRTVLPSVARVPAPRARTPNGPTSSNRAHTVLSRYVNAMENQRTLTRRMMKDYLGRVGYAPNRANQFARAYEAKWVANRANVKSAMRHIANGKNLNKLGFQPNIKTLAQRRVNLKLTNTPNSRIRIKGRIANGYKKPELLALARNHRVTANAKMTKAQIISALFG